MSKPCLGTGEVGDSSIKWESYFEESNPTMCYTSRDHRAEQEARRKREARERQEAGKAQRPEKASPPKRDRELVRA